MQTKSVNQALKMSRSSTQTVINVDTGQAICVDNLFRGFRSLRCRLLYASLTIHNFKSIGKENIRHQEKKTYLSIPDIFFSF